MDRIAERAGISRESARAVLRDDTARVAPDGTVVFVDDFPGSEDAHDDPASATAPAPVRGAGRTATGVRRADEVFSLHSDPTADQTIYLDFDGAELVDTDWNGFVSNLPDGSYGGYSIDDDPAFNPYELLLIEQTWRETSAYFSAFDIDVTTEEPSRARLQRSGESDTEFGTWVIVSTDSDLEYDTCGSCGGVATVGRYNDLDGRQWERPAFAFASDATVVAHEVGHELGLAHDGLRRPDGSTEEYYAGHGHWAPIMGAGAAPNSISQWSVGDYTGATNTEDDYVVMAAHGLLWRPDRAGSTPGAAAAPGFESLGHDDVDVFTLPTCSGALVVSAEVPDGSSLDASLDLLDASGAVIATSAAPVGDSAGQVLLQREGQSEVLRDTSGLARFARVRPGSVPGVDGYPTYGSIGGYQLDAACDPIAPGAPQDLRVDVSYRSIALRWTAPVDGLVTGYRVWVGSRSQLVPAGVRQVELFAGPEESGATVGVEAVAGDRAGQRTTAEVRFPPTPTFDLSMPVVDVAAGSAALSWTATISPEITDAVWVVFSDSVGEQMSLPLAARSATLGILPESGSLPVELCLSIRMRENSSFTMCDNATAAFPAIAAAPQGLTANSTDFHGTAEVSWSGVADATGYELSVDRGPWTSASSPAQVTDLDAGMREIRVRAITPSGPGSAARTRVEVRLAPSAPRNVVAVPSDDGTSIRLTWEPPEDDRGLTHYLLGVANEDVQISIPATARTYTLTGRTPGTRVDIFFSGAGDVVSGEYVYLPVLMPGGAVDDPLPQPSLTRVKPGAKGGRATLSVAWTAAVDESRLAGWELSFASSGGGGKVVRTASASAASRAYEMRLPKGRRWRVKVRALGADGERGPWSATSKAVAAHREVRDGSAGNS